MPNNQQYSISELAAEFDITTRTIRFYEEKGLLRPGRNGNNRVYSTGDRVKLKLILRGKRLGFSLEESATIVAMYDPEHGNVDQLQKLIATVRGKRSQLQQKMHDLEVMMVDLHESEQKCLQALADTKAKATN